MAFAGWQALPVAMLVMQRSAVSVHRHDGRVGQLGIGLAAGGEKHEAHLKLAESRLERSFHRPVSGQCLHGRLLDTLDFPGRLAGAVIIQVRQQRPGILVAADIQPPPLGWIA